MYRQLKLAIKSIVPESLLFGLEPYMRSIYAIPFKGGNRYLCSICKSQLKKWIPINDGADQLCPACGSIARTRLLSMVLDSNLALPEQSWRVLHFSPSRALKRKLRKYTSLEYITTDYESQYEDRNYDITSIGETDNSFDLVICFHVLEHIPDDRKAMEELYRIIKPGATVLLQTPFQKGATYEDPSITSEAEREKHFGQKDHVRIYGFDDFLKRLEAVGFNVKRQNANELLGSAELEQLQVKASSVIVFATK